MVNNFIKLLMKLVEFFVFVGREYGEIGESFRGSLGEIVVYYFREFFFVVLLFFGG